MPETPVGAIELVLDYLVGEGVEYVFGVPGGALVPLYEALAGREAIRPVLTKHEAGAAFMADGYARVRRGLGVCCGTTGPGATNALTGVACAHADSIPLLLLTAQVSTAGLGRGAAQECSPFYGDTVALYTAVTKLSAVVPDGTKAGELVRRSLRAALTGRTGAVHLSVPGDVARARVPRDLRPASAYRPLSRPVDRDGVRRVADLLRRAERPCLFAGHGTNLAHAGPALARLSERHGLPVATTPKAKGVLREDHPLALGVFGYGGSRWADRYLTDHDVDVLVVVGSSLGELATNAWDPRLQPTRALVQIDVDPESVGLNYRVQLGLVGDARATLEALAAELGDEPLPSAESSRVRLSVLRRAMPRRHEVDRATGPGTVHPVDLVDGVARVMPADAMLFVDIGNCMSWFLHYHECRRPDSFFISLGWASMGSSIGIAIGGAMAAPGRRALVAVGDAAFAMSGMEVHTAVEYDVPVTFIVLNDGGHGMVAHGDELLFARSVCPARFRGPLDVRQIAEGLGARAFAARSPIELDRVLAAALAEPGPSVVDVAIDPRVVPPPLRTRADTLKHYFASRGTSHTTTTSDK
ncbi:thiamine pyrophosphate-binding protein [Nannocystis punicea]|uniref:Thiamine pyrophosphate-binding protein n=1 Tax=Nannocystis punicea TaxID=2995304 RepID=A0ABY7HCI7_9BACT|nr:thiamine pyrophosphate-binding protein [Nannocystis poenicansa]WAS96739.1 thiamine pyrophosphate-binding protein [Nannocystis poenicansa]